METGRLASRCHLFVTFSPARPGAQRPGSTGHWPVPSGDPPLGTGRRPDFFGPLFSLPTSCPFRPASGRTAQAGRLCHPSQLRSSGFVICRIAELHSAWHPPAPEIQPGAARCRLQIGDTAECNSALRLRSQAKAWSAYSRRAWLRRGVAATQFFPRAGKGIFHQGNKGNKESSLSSSTRTTGARVARPRVVCVLETRGRAARAPGFSDRLLAALLG